MEKNIAYEGNKEASRKYVERVANNTLEALTSGAVKFSTKHNIEIEDAFISCLSKFLKLPSVKDALALSCMTPDSSDEIGKKIMDNVDRRRSALDLDNASDRASHRNLLSSMVEVWNGDAVSSRALAVSTGFSRSQLVRGLSAKSHAPASDLKRCGARYWTCKEEDFVSTYIAGTLTPHNDMSRHAKLKLSNGLIEFHQQELLPAQLVELYRAFQKDHPDFRRGTMSQSKFSSLVPYYARPPSPEECVCPECHNMYVLLQSHQSLVPKVHRLMFAAYFTKRRDILENFEAERIALLAAEEKLEEDIIRVKALLEQANGYEQARSREIQSQATILDGLRSELRQAQAKLGPQQEAALALCESAIRAQHVVPAKEAELAERNLQLKRANRKAGQHAIPCLDVYLEQVAAKSPDPPVSLPSKSDLTCCRTCSSHPFSKPGQGDIGADVRSWPRNLSPAEAVKLLSCEGALDTKNPSNVKRKCCWVLGSDERGCTLCGWQNKIKPCPALCTDSIQVSWKHVEQVILLQCGHGDFHCVVPTARLLVQVKTDGGAQYVIRTKTGTPRDFMTEFFVTFFLFRSHHFHAIWQAYAERETPFNMPPSSFVFKADFIMK